MSQAMMGGIGIAVVDPTSVVAANPASYAGLKQTCFELGLVVRNSRYSTAQTYGIGRRTDLLGFSVGVPFGRGKFGLALGLNPVSKVAYQINDTGPLPDGTGQVTYRYTGDGGLNRAFLGLAWNVINVRDSLNNGHRLAIGANLEYVFGRIEETRKAIYPVASGHYNTSASSSLAMRNPTGSVGIQFQGDFRKHQVRGDKALHYLAGISADLPTNLNAQRTELLTSFGRNSAGAEFPFDTIRIAQGSKQALQLPLGLGAGFTVFDLNWTVSAEVRFKEWSNVLINERATAQAALANSVSYAVGASWRPAGEIGGTFLERTIYRLGARYKSD